MEPLPEANNTHHDVHDKVGEPQLNDEFYLSFDNLPINLPVDRDTLSVLANETQFQPYALGGLESFRTGGAKLQYPTEVNYPDIEIGFIERRDLPVMKTFYERWQRKIWNKPGLQNVTEEEKGIFNPPAQWMGGFSLYPINTRSGPGSPPEYAGYYSLTDVYPTENDPMTFNYENKAEETLLTLSFHVHHVENNF